MNNEEFRATFIAAANPLIQFLNNHPDRLHPHFTVIVTPTSAELMQGDLAHKTMEFVKD